MSVWSRLGSWLDVRNRRELVMSPPQWGVRWLPVFEAGVALTVEEALHVPTVWACMDALVKTLAPRPWRVYEIDGDVKTVRRGDPLDYVLNTRPNPEMTAIALREALQYSAIGWGNGYAEIVRSGRGDVSELWPLEPDRVVPWRKEETNEEGREGELGYRITQYSGGQVWVPARRIFHVRGPASMNGVAGDNLLVRASRAIAISASAQQFSASYFRNGSILSGVLETDKKITDTNVIGNIRAQFAERYSGPQNAGLPLILPEGLKYREIASDPNKSQLLDTRKFQVEEIARYFGVPLQMIQVTQGAHGYGSNIEQLGIAFVRETLRPWAERFEQEADYKLITARAPGRETKIDLSELMLGDFVSQVDGACKAVVGGILTINEARDRFGWNHIGPDGDVHFLPSTAKTVEQIIEPPEPPSLPALPGRVDAKPGETKTGTGEGAENARRAVVVACASALRRYARSIASRAAAVAGKDGAEAKVAAERDRLLPFLAEECAEALAVLSLPKQLNGEIVGAAQLAESGEPPTAAAEHLVALLEIA